MEAAAFGSITGALHTPPSESPDYVGHPSKEIYIAYGTLERARTSLTLAGVAIISKRFNDHWDADCSLKPGTQRYAVLLLLQRRFYAVPAHDY